MSLRVSMSSLSFVNKLKHRVVATKNFVAMSNDGDDVTAEEGGQFIGGHSGGRDNDIEGRTLMATGVGEDVWGESEEEGAEEAQALPPQRNVPVQL